MSFKRDGDDEALLHNLKMRRVVELLSEHIPEDEAKLLSNGRLTCLICSHRPIFDTFNVLANHRKGKKHIEELGKYLIHKRELEYKKLKRDQQKCVETEANREKCKAEKNVRFHRKPIIGVSLPKAALSQGEAKSLNVRSPSSQVRHYLKEFQRKRALQKTVERCRETYSIESLPLAVAIDSKATLPIRSNVVKNKGIPASTNTTKELQLRMSGWIKTPEGKWVKDPAVEFDSDEEPPDESI